MREGRGGRTREEKRKGELKGSRYASVGVGPDWARVSTRFSGAGIAGTREENRERKRKREKAETERERRTKRRIREILERKRVQSERGAIASRVGRIASNSQKFMAGASTYEQEVLLPGPWGRDRKIYATPAGEEERESEAENGKRERAGEGRPKRDPRMRACTLTKERSSSLTSVRIIDSTDAASDYRVRERRENSFLHTGNKYLDVERKPDCDATSRRRIKQRE